MATPSVRSPRDRDDALRRAALLRRWSLGIATGMTGLLATVAALGNPGHATATAAPTSTASGQTADAGSVGTDDGLQAPVQPPNSSGGSGPVAVSGGS